MANRNLAVLGATGNIGTEFTRGVAEKDDGTRIIAMAHRDGTIFNPRGLGIQHDPALLSALQRRDIELASQGLPRAALKEHINAQREYQDGSNLGDLFNQISQLGMLDDVIFVDLTAGDLTDFHRTVVDNGGRIVTANKIPAAQCSYDVFRSITQCRERYGFNCTVMAGAGAVPFLKSSFDTNDTVKSIEGCFSGTLGKLCNLLQEGNITFSEAVNQLKIDGDTEPDPRDDLSGMDVAKKIVILARTAGYEVNLEDVQIEPFIAGGFRELADVEVKEFMAKANIFDQEIAAQFKAAKEQGKTLKYVASLTIEDGKPIVKLGLREEKLDSALGSLKGSGNKVVVYTESYSGVPYELAAPGSGTLITATNVRRELSQMLPSLKV